MLLQSDRIFLRAPEPTDLDFLYQFENDTTLWPVSLSVAPFSKDVLQQYLENATADIYAARQLRLMVCKLDDHSLIGTIDLFDFEPMHQRAGIGIALLQQQRGQGFGAEALKLLLHYTSSILQLHQVYCSISADNDKSIRLFREAGFKEVGLRKDWLRTPGGWKDVVELQKVLI